MGDDESPDIASSSTTAGLSPDAANNNQDGHPFKCLECSLEPGQLPIVYNPNYNLSVLGLEKFHPFDSAKWGKVFGFLVDGGYLSEQSYVTAVPVTDEILQTVHTKRYLNSLRYSYVIARITEVPPAAFVPNFILQKKFLGPMKLHVGGSVMATHLALTAPAASATQPGWAINLGGGFHHCSSDRGGGFCVYADLTIAIRYALDYMGVKSVLLIDLDAHQGNGHETDFLDDPRVYIMDMFNSGIYPHDRKALPAIRTPVGLHSGIRDEKYLYLLIEALRKVKSNCPDPDLIVYNAGTDILAGDPLGRLQISPEGVATRDETVFRFARETMGKPIVMMTSGGYLKSNGRVIADSIINLFHKSIISSPPTSLKMTSF